MNSGKLHQIKKCYWLLYPSKDIASDNTLAVSPRLGMTAAVVCERTAADLSKEFNCNVSYISENSIFCLLEEDGQYLKVLTSNGELGWIIYQEDSKWTKGCIEEVNQ